MLRRFYWWQVVGNIGLYFAGSTSLPEMLALGTNLSCTNFDWGEFYTPPLPSKIQSISWLTRIDQ